MKYLEMIQAVISRMAQNCFLLKGWAITLIVGIFALSANNAGLIIYLLVYVPIILFWVMDSYYLQLERRYKVLYERAAKIDADSVDFNLTPPKPDMRAKTLYPQSLFSRTEMGFYLPLAVMVALVIAIGEM